MKTKIFLAALTAGLLWPAFTQAQVSVSSVITNGLMEPYSVVVDDANNAYLSESVNNRILRLDAASGNVTVLAGFADQPPGSADGPAFLATFNNPLGLVLATLGGAQGLLVADSGNSSIRFVSFADGNVITVAGLAEAADIVDGGPGVSRLVYPVGMANDGAGRVYIADAGIPGSVASWIRILDLASTNLSTLAVTGTTFNRPAALTFSGTNQLWVADTRNHKVKLLELSAWNSGVLKSELGNGLLGHRDMALGVSAQFNGPRGLLWTGEGLLISDTANHVIRMATNNVFNDPIKYATNYSVFTFAGTPERNGLVDGLAAQAHFDTPIGLAKDAETAAYFVADLKNGALRRIQDGPVKPAVSTPKIGWVDFIWNDAMATWVTKLRTDDQPREFNNRVYFAILREEGTDCHYTVTNTPWPAGFTDWVENPSKTVGNTPPVYRDGMLKSDFDANPEWYGIIMEGTTVLPGLVIKAVGFQVGRQNSGIARANYSFKVATPTISGGNLASFNVACATVNPAADLFYTMDGSDPTEDDTRVPMNGKLQLNFPDGVTNVEVRVRGFAPKYETSEVQLKTFVRDNFIPTRICLGFPGGEASSKFLAAPGQTFYTPVTLSLAESEDMYSLQFNLVVTNLNGPKITGQLDFASMLYEKVAVSKGEKSPPGDKNWYRAIPPAMWSATPTNRVIRRDSDPTIPLMDLRFFNQESGLIGVGWIERWNFKDLYDTTKQDLIAYSIARDTMFLKSGKRVVLGAGAFEVPPIATDGAQYQLTLGRPSATSDGVGAPGSLVDVANPISGYLTNGGYYAQRVVDVRSGVERYTVGDVAPFRWLNAGDFGNSNLLNDDVLQVFECALYNLSPADPFTGYPSDPPYYSDLRDAMDAGPMLGNTNVAAGYCTPAGPTADVNALFDGNDTDINYIAFGDGTLDVTDVYITFRRSLDPSLTWWRRYYMNGMRVAEPIVNGSPSPSPSPSYAPRPPEMSGGDNGETPAIVFEAGDAVGTAGQTLGIPIRARISGSYPLRVLMLNLSVQPLDGSPDLVDDVQFTPVAALGTPTFSRQRTTGYGAAWLNSAIVGMQGDVLLGTLTITVPTNAPANAAYGIQFTHASGSPNGLASFPQQVCPGLVTLADRSLSTLGDGIPDAWRLRYFSSVYAILADANADADGDGHCNRAEFNTGTNPNDSQSVLRMRSQQPADISQAFSVRWPSVAGKRYVIERAAALFDAVWMPVGTNTGNGFEMQFEDLDTAAGGRFYRVRVTE